MPTSQNSWSASPNLQLRPFVAGGVSFAPGIRDNDDVETVLRYVVEQYAARVEPLKSPGCWGWSYRENRNDPNSLSNHASGTAVDVNAPAHPNGVPTSHTFTAAQVAEVHKILAEVDRAIRWGGDYAGTPDAMHFEVNCNAATLHAVAERLRDDIVTEDDINKIAAKVVDLLTNGKPAGSDLSRDVLLKQAQKASVEARDLLQAGNGKAKGK